MAESDDDRSALRGFLIHLAAYAAVNAGLAAWALMRTPARYGFAWVLAGWGVGVAAHGLALWLRRLGRGGGAFEEKDVRCAAVHLFVYLAVNALLIAVNLIRSPTDLWFYWPLIGWGVGLAFHAWRVYRAALTRMLEHYALEQRLIGEITQERRAAELAAAVVPGMQLEPDAAEETAKPKRKRAPAKKRSHTTQAKSASKAKAPAKTPAAKKAHSKKKGARKSASRRKTQSSTASKSA